MNIKTITTGLIAGILSYICLPAVLAQTNTPACSEPCTCSGSKAPIGVMGDHMHKEGDVMFSYRFMYMDMDGARTGTRNLSSRQVLDMGYMMAPVEMHTEMHMLGAMYAPSDDLTLMLMANYVEKDMDMVSMSGHGMGHGSMDTGHGSLSTRNHESSGWGDTVATALIRLWGDCCQTIHAGIGLGLPTAEVEERMNGMYQPYGMQLGNGVWDVRPSITYNGGACGFNWGGQLSGRINLEDENDAGFAYGNQFSATVWLAKEITEGFSLSGRMAYDHQDDIENKYNEETSLGSPGLRPQNYGGDVIQAGIGASIKKMKYGRFSIEVLTPVYEDVNGVQLSRDYSVIAGWQKGL